MIKKKYTYYLDPELIKELRSACLNLDLRFSHVLEEAIREWIERKKVLRINDKK